MEKSRTNATSPHPAPRLIRLPILSAEAQHNGDMSQMCFLCGTERANVALIPTDVHKAAGGRIRLPVAFLSENAKKHMFSVPAAKTLHVMRIQRDITRRSISHTHTHTPSLLPPFITAEQPNHSLCILTKTKWCQPVAFSRVYTPSSPPPRRPRPSPSPQRRLVAAWVINLGRADR